MSNLNYLVSNVNGRKHKKIYDKLGRDDICFYDLESSQFGWDDYLNVKIGDMVYVINESKNVAVAYEVSEINDGILLSDDKGKVLSLAGGDARVLFGKIVKRIDKAYPDFVLANNIISAKLDPRTGQMYQGFNCVAF